MQHYRMMQRLKRSESTTGLDREALRESSVACSRLMPVLALLADILDITCPVLTIHHRSLFGS